MTDEPALTSLDVLAAQVAVLNRNVAELSIMVAGTIAESKLGGPLREIVEMVSQHFGISVEKIRGERRCADYVTARWVGMYLAYELTGYSKARIGRFYRRDHTSVIHALRKVAEWQAAGDGRVADILALKHVLEPRIRALLGVERIGPEIVEAQG